MAGFTPFICVALVLSASVAAAFVVPVGRARASVSRSCLRSGSMHRTAEIRRQHGARSLSANLPEGLSGKERLGKFLEDCEILGPMRFTILSDGAILEAVGSFDNLRYNDLPKGRYATCSEGDGFECHINTDKIKSVQMVTKPSPAGDYELYITRFLDENGETMLSAMLHGKEGSYEPGAADYWEKLRTTFGAEQSVA